MILYAIRERSTGFYLPQQKSNFTESEPTKDCIPRLHKDRATANRVLSQWLQGRCHLIYRQVGGWDGPPDTEIDFEVIKDENRKKENMEVVAIKLMVGINTYFGAMLNKGEVNIEWNEL